MDECLFHPMGSCIESFNKPWISVSNCASKLNTYMTLIKMINKEKTLKLIIGIGLYHNASGSFSTTSALGEISTAPPNCNSNPYEKKAKDIMK
jgi:hypothetical protein